MQHPAKLPGAFVGMLLGGASPVEAGAVQLLVLLLLLAVQTVSVALTMELVCRGRVHRDTKPSEILAERVSIRFGRRNRRQAVDGAEAPRSR